MLSKFHKSYGTSSQFYAIVSALSKTKTNNSCKNLNRMYKTLELMQSSFNQPLKAGLVNTLLS